MHIFKPRRLHYSMLDKNPLNLKVTSAGTQKILPQTGKRVSMPRDAGRSAKLPGKRISKTGKVYWETRKNRSDMPLKNI